MRHVKIGDRLIGEGHPVFIIAEIGYNFTSVAEAKASIDAAIECGVDAVKFQTFRAETVVSRHTDFPAEAGATNQFEEFKRYEISEDLHRELFAYARDKKVLVFSTPSYFDDVDLLERLQVAVYKIGSDDLTNLPFIRYVAEKGKPLIFSSGMGTLAEVDEAVQTIRAVGNDQIVILHCVSNYPIRELRGLNLNVIRTFQQAFNVPVGFSDHTTTLSASLGAVALGASVIERHFTLDKHLNVPDAFFSADPAEMKTLVQCIRELEQALGTGVKRPVPSEENMRSETRKSVIARTALRPGEVITKDKIIVKRPGTGVPPKLAHLVVGRRAKQAIQVDEVITWDKLD
jgi:N,N'-diacetyllegionaminate synthase